MEKNINQYTQMPKWDKNNYSSWQEWAEDCYKAGKKENKELMSEMKEALEAFHEMFVHKEGETKKNKLKTDMITYCDEVKDALNKSRSILWYKVNQLQ